MHLRNGSVHEFSSADPGHYSLSAFGERDLPVEVKSAGSDHVSEPGIPGRTMSVLWQERGTQREAGVELQRRLSFPFACIAFALLAMPIGARPRRGGRAAGFLITLVLITGYYLMFTIGAGLAREGTIPIWMGIWSANVITAALGLFLLPRLERMPDSSRSVAAWEWFAGWRVWKIFSREEQAAPAARNGSSAAGRIFSRKKGRTGIPQLLDVYLLRSFVYYFVLLTVGFILLFEVFTFFELLDDFAQHRAGAVEIALYFIYLACYLFYQLAPLAALVSVLVTLGVMTKNNELVAFKASGLSLYRIALPLLLAGVFLAASLLILDDTYLPYANQRQDALRNQIKGRPAQTYYQPSRQWIYGESAKIYNYELFDPDRELFGGLNVFELNPATFEIRRRIYAARAHWDPQQGLWILESGWIRDFDHGQLTAYHALSGRRAERAQRAALLFQPRSPPVLPNDLVGAGTLHRRSAPGRVRRRAPFGPIAEETFLSPRRPHHHSIGNPLFDSGGNARRRRRSGAWGGNSDRLLGGVGSHGSDGCRRAIAPDSGRLGARHRFRIPRIVLLPENANVKP